MSKNDNVLVYAVSVGDGFLFFFSALHITSFSADECQKRLFTVFTNSFQRPVFAIFREILIVDLCVSCRTLYGRRVMET